MPNRRDSGLVKSDETLLAIIERLKDLDGAGVTEIATELDMAKSAVHKHLRTMVEHGYVVKQESAYHIGLQFLNDGVDARGRYDVYHAAKPVVDGLSAKTGEMASLIVEENGRGMYLYSSRGQTEIEIESVIGSWITLHNNSGGKAILAHLPDDQVEEIVDRHGLPAKTEATVTDRETLFAELETVRERGYAVNRGEDIGGIHAVGVPIVYQGTVCGALAVAGAANRLNSTEREREIVDTLRTAAHDAEVNLAY